MVVGNRMMAAGEYDLALRAYLRAAGEQGATAEVLTAMGSANLKLGRLGQAEGLLRRAVRTDAEYVPGLNNLGVVLMEKGEIPEAARVFRAAVAADSGESDAIRANLALALARLDQTTPKDNLEASFTLLRGGGATYRIQSTDRDVRPRD
ncbi:TPR domain protein [Oceaniovalibus guishaninsula JLT2003]|uniref:TPR domain protein n=2 Tax=Oceaniovalibus TaxID=1207070 RepID=K2HA76_9RHOB|nr:TPR domain protein [Oceaniovalibus guishaninsula JLT2003]